MPIAISPMIHSPCDAIDHDAPNVRQSIYLFIAPQFSSYLWCWTCNLLLPSVGSRDTRKACGKVTWGMRNMHVPGRSRVFAQLYRCVRFTGKAALYEADTRSPS